MTATHATVVATVDLNGQDPEVMRTTIERTLATLGVTLIPCGWAPDLDTVEECSGLEFGSITLLDLNPAPAH